MSKASKRKARNKRAPASHREPVLKPGIEVSKQSLNSSKQDIQARHARFVDELLQKVRNPDPEAELRAKFDELFAEDLLD